ncbi:PQQ-binding-like beta-propeller repeat protein [Dactylosporangium sp. AC04546]|uniref:outer membrane protein assembly factor BamB family protein n=1 Tax=Dactylosporangium sp. AC04546 TaxID=2862460 RepID=UPI001EDF01FB|nr:PQQ-binding-like beta-propeller repeat protein [Dactylosporangium sp. AC04546]WVK86091.1 PQQ-binding-like beta-propeller repeat protein [Dactylosporangium sp. AC04546]
MHTHALADDLRPRRSLWLSRRARWTVAIVLALAVLLAVGLVVYRLNQQPYAFDRLTRVAAVGYQAAGPGATRAYLDGGRAFVGHPTGGGHYDLRAVDVEEPGKPIWVNSSLTEVDTFRGARGSVEVTGRPDKDGLRTVTLLNASNGVPFATFEVAERDVWVLVGKYFLRYRDSDHKLSISDVGTGKEIAALDQPGGPRSWWLVDNWSGQQVPTSVDGVQLDEPFTVDPHIVRATPGGGLEVVSLSSGKALSAAAGLAGPDDLVYPYDEQVFVANRQSGQVRAYDRKALGKPQWSWSPPTVGSLPTLLTVCGERRVCVGEEQHVTALDIRTGKVDWRLDADHAGHLVPVGDRVMLRHGTGDGKRSSLVDASGRIVTSWPGTQAARLDEGSYLLFPLEVPVSGPFPWTGVEAGNGRARQLGDLDVRLDSCTWSHKYVACAAPGEFVFYKVRTPWYSGRL